MKKNRVIEHGQESLERLLKKNFNRQLDVLRSLNTATKKRRSLKRSGENSVRTKLGASLPADEVPTGQDAGKESQRRLSSMNSRIESGTSPNST
jgi:hypothetical protein